MKITSLNSFPKVFKRKNNFFFILILLLILFQTSYAYSCGASDNFNTEACFNDIIKINNKKYRAGQIKVNKNTDIIIEYSDNDPGDSRLFYSLKENGRGFYENEEVRKEISLSSDQYFTDDKHDNKKYHIIGRYECINDFIYLKADTSRTKQYLFSISSFASLTELHDIEKGTYQQWVTTDFIHIFLQFVPLYQDFILRNKLIRIIFL